MRKLSGMQQISFTEAKEFLLPRHYSGRSPSLSWAFGWIIDDELQAVCTFGKPASPFVCDGVCGKEWSSQVYELNRLCRKDNFSFPLSMFVSYCLRELKRMNLIIVSYSDMAMNHHGYIYQSCNFLYTGCTKEKTDLYKEGYHPRHYDKDGTDRQLRSSKHRYVYFCAPKNIKREMLKCLRYPILPYPKGDNQNYKLGEYLKPQIIKGN